MRERWLVVQGKHIQVGQLTRRAVHVMAVAREAILARIARRILLVAPHAPEVEPRDVLRRGLVCANSSARCEAESAGRDVVPEAAEILEAFQ